MTGVMHLDSLSGMGHSARKQGKKKRRRLVIAVTVDPELLLRLDAVAEALSLNRSQMLEQLVRDGIEEQETYARALSNPLIAKAFGAAITQPGVLRAMAAAMGEELQPEQLKLFERAMSAAVAVIAPACDSSTRSSPDAGRVPANALRCSPVSGSTCTENTRDVCPHSDTRRIIARRG